MPPSDRADDEHVDLLLLGEAEVIGRFADASNATLLLAFRGEDGGLPALPDEAGPGDLDPHRFAVYKPMAGERPLWDFPDGSLWRREVAACVVDRALGLDMVPTTVGRDDLEHGIGAVQRLVPHEPAEHYFAIRDDEELWPQLRLMVAFDLLLDNADRKGGHVLVERLPDGERRIRLIDHGVCFHPEPHLRTVAWDFGGESMDDDERDLGARLAALLEEGHPAVAALEGLLSGRELEALLTRARLLATTTHFPVPAHDRQYPWPLL